MCALSCGEGSLTQVGGSPAGGHTSQRCKARQWKTRRRSQSSEQLRPSSPPMQCTGFCTCNTITYSYLLHNVHRIHCALRCALYSCIVCIRSTMYCVICNFQGLSVGHATYTILLSIALTQHSKIMCNVCCPTIV